MATFLFARRYTAVAIFVLAILMVPYLRHEQDWATVYLPAAARLTGGGDIYEEGKGFVYPPINAWLPLPFLALPYAAGRLLWYAANMAALFTLVLGAWRLSGGGRLDGHARIQWREETIFWLGLACGISSCFDAVTNEQTDLIIGALVILGCLALVAGKELRAGVWFGVAAAIKCTPLLWAAYLAWRKKWTAAFLVGAVAVAMNLIPDLTHPTGNSAPRLQAWTSRYLLPMAESKFEPGTWACGVGGNQSVAGIWQRCLIYDVSWNGEDLDIVTSASRATPARIKAWAWSTMALLLVAGLACTWRTPSRGAGFQPAVSPRGRLEACPTYRADALGPSAPALEFGLVLILMVLLSPHSSKPHYCTLMLPGFCVARAALIGRSRQLTVVLVAAIVCALSSNKDLVGNHFYAWCKWYGALAWGAVLLYAVSCRILMARQRPVAASTQDHEPIPLRRAA